MDFTELARFMDVPLEIEALVEGPKLRVRDLIALKTGDIIETALPAGENIEVRAGQSPLGAGELAASSGKVIVRVIRFQGDE
jgi:flagellar motor switch/type III secretory pathway protein FliN